MNHEVDRITHIIYSSSNNALIGITPMDQSSDNAAIFAFAHIIFRSVPVLVLTFTGGIFFASTYYKTKSLIITSIEHALYGSLLFTLGAGEMLAFPT